MDFANLLGTLTEATKKIFVEEGINDLNTLQALSSDDLKGAGVELGDLAKLKPKKREREEEKEEESNGRSGAFLRLLEGGLIEDPLLLGSLIPKNWEMGCVQHATQVWRARWSGNSHLWEELGFVGLLVDHIVAQDNTNRTSSAPS